MFGCRRQPAFQMQGQTMGTAFTIKALAVPPAAKARISTEISRRLEEINACLSIHRPDSEISRFNSSGQKNRFNASEDFQNVLATSLHVHDLTSGAFDPSIKPLADLWGFGPDSGCARPWSPPDPRDIRHVLEFTGLDKVSALPSGQGFTADPRMQLDFGAVAKGYAVDEIAKILRQHGIKHFLVEIGGDLFAGGRNQANRPWRVGVNRPSPEAAGDDVILVLELQDRAVATSGDYRQFFRHADQMYSHVLDPRTGFPVRNRVAAVTVLAPCAAVADALATGLMVLGVDAGLAVVEQLADTEALFVSRDATEGWTLAVSSGFRAATGLERNPMPRQ